MSSNDIFSPIDMAKARPSESNRTARRLAKVSPRENSLVLFARGSKIWLANAPARGKVNKIVTNLCVQGKLESLLDDISIFKGSFFFAALLAGLFAD